MVGRVVGYRAGAGFIGIVRNECVRVPSMVFCILCRDKCASIRKYRLNSKCPRVNNRVSRSNIHLLKFLGNSLVSGCFGFLMNRR